MKRYYLCVVPHYWGRGETIEDAKKQARKAGADNVNKRDGYIIHAYDVPEGTPDKDLPYLGEDSYIRHMPGTVGVYVELVRDKDGRMLEGSKEGAHAEG